MPDNDIWPPKPDLPDPLTEYDELIAAKLAALTKPGSRPNRLLLIRALRNEEGMQLQQAYVLVNHYFDRHGLLVTGGAAKAFAWGECGLTFGAVCLASFNVYFLIFRHGAILRQPHHYAALIAQDRQEMVITEATGLFILVSITISCTILRGRRKRE